MSAEAEGRREDFMQLYKQKEEQQVELIDRILSDENIEAAIRAVQRNQGAPGIDKMPVGMLKSYFAEHGEEIKKQIREKKYQPQPKGNDDAQKEPKPDDDKKQQGEGGGNESGELIKSLRDKISQIEKRFNEEDAKNKKQETEKVVKAKMKELGADDDYVLSKTLQVADLSGDNADDIAKNLMKAYDKEYKLCRGKGARPHAGVSIQGNGGDSSIDEFFKKKAAKEHWKTAPAK